MNSWNSRWKSFLENAGAEFEADRVIHFGNPSRELRVATSGSIITDLSHLGLIQAHGPEAMKFLQGQLTSDVAAVDAGRTRLSGYCSPKGRLLALLRLFSRDEGYFLQLPVSLCDTTLERLRKYLMMSRLTLENRSASLIGIGLSGPHCERQLQEILGGVPVGSDEVIQIGELTVLRIPGIHPRFEIYGPVEAVEKTWSLLDVHAAPVGSDAWSLLDALAGLPAVHPETVDEFIPQTVNLDLLDGISFNKGCYTGQEIIARLHYRGTVKRRMYLTHCNNPDRPRPGEPVHTPEAEAQIGQVVLSAPAPDGGYLALVTVMIEHARTGHLRLGSQTGPEMVLRDLPYLKVDAEVS